MGAVGRMYPPLTHLRDCSIKIAAKVAEDAYADKSASTYPEPADKEAFIRKQLYDYEYDGVSALPSRYAWPEDVIAPIPRCKMKEKKTMIFFVCFSLTNP